MSFNFTLFEILKGQIWLHVPLWSHRSQQTKIPAHQQTEELYPTGGSEESEEDTEAKEKTIDCMSLPREKLVQSQKKTAQLIKEKMVKQKTHEVLVFI